MLIPLLTETKFYQARKEQNIMIKKKKMINVGPIPIDTISPDR